MNLEEKLKISYNKEVKIIEGYYRGAANAQIGRQVIEALVAEMQKHDCPLVLFDVSQALSTATTAENFEFAKAIPSLLDALAYFRWAIIYENDAHMYEMVYKMVQQSGVEYILLTQDKTEALNWLLGGDK